MSAEKSTKKKLKEGTSNLSASFWVKPLQAISNEKRFKIFTFLENNEASFTEIADYLDISSPTLRFHLYRLLEEGIVNNSYRIGSNPSSGRMTYSYYNLSELGQKIFEVLKNAQDKEDKTQ